MNNNLPNKKIDSRPVPKPTSSPTNKESQDDNSDTQSSLWGRVTGKSHLENFKQQRYKPYTYQSNSGRLVWIIIVAILLIVVLSLSSWFNAQNTSLYTDWQNRGWSVLPPRYIDIDAVAEFSNKNSIDCEVTLQSLNYPSPHPCAQVLDSWVLFRTSRDRVDIFLIFIAFLLIALAFLFGNFTYTASRNLLTLKSKGQNLRPELSVLWLFVPIANFFMPYISFSELFKASDPTVNEANNSQETWKHKGLSPPILILWQILLIASVLINQITVGRVASPFLSGNPVDNAIVESTLTMYADIVMALFILLTLFVALALNLRQERKYLIIGPFKVSAQKEAD